MSDAQAPEGARPLEGVGAAHAAASPGEGR